MKRLLILAAILAVAGCASNNGSIPRGKAPERLDKAMADYYQVIADANAQPYDLHLAIHSNASPEASAGKNTGVEIYHFPTSERGKRFAEVLADTYRRVYREPGNIRIIPTRSLAELRRTKAPAVLIEVGYHDNREEAQWIRDNIDNIARALAQSVVAYFGQEFVDPMA